MVEHTDDLRHDLGSLGDRAVDRTLELAPARLVDLLGLGQHGEALGAQARVGDPNGDNPAGHDPIDALDDLLDVLRIDVAPADDDQVPDPARHEQLAGGEVAEVAREVAPVADRLRGRVDVVVVTAHQARRTQRDLADRSLGQLLTARSHDHQVDARAAAGPS